MQRCLEAYGREGRMPTLSESTSLQPEVSSDYPKVEDKGQTHRMAAQPVAKS